MEKVTNEGLLARLFTLATFNLLYFFYLFLQPQQPLKWYIICETAGKTR